MNYKLWLMLIVILLLILYLIKETYFIKFDLVNYITMLKNTHEENSIFLRKNFQNDLNVFANKIKLLNDENLQQFRKITLINTQPIVKNNNFFKEMSCSESENENNNDENELKYLSDNNKIIVSSNKVKNKNENINVDIEHKCENLELRNNLITTVYDSKKNTPSVLMESTNVIDEKNNAFVETKNIDDENSKSSKSSYIVNNNIICEISKSINETDEKQNSKTSKLFNNTENNESSKSSVIMGNVNHTDDENENNEDTDDNKNNEDSEDSEDNSIYNNNELDMSDIDSDVNLSTEEIIFNKEDLYKSPKSKIYDNILLDTITLGTKKSETQKKTSINTDLHGIVVGTEVIKNLNKENIKTMDEYTMETLKNMAKNLGIQISTKVSGKWKQLNKTELYNEIINCLNKTTVKIETNK